MPHLSLNLLGGFVATLDGQPLTAFGTVKVRALLAYLAVESAHPHQRSALAGLFWPNSPPAKAGHNLSQTLLRLRRALREDTARQPFLLLTSQAVQFNPIGDCQLDVARFSALLTACRQHVHTRAETCHVCMGWLAQAADLYRGDFLAGFTLRDSVLFEEWQLVQQEGLRRQAVDVLIQLGTYHESRGEPELVQRYARRLIAIEPWHEQGQLQLMRALARDGQITAALETYAVNSRALAEGFGILPSAEATALFQQIQAGQIGRGVVSGPSPDRSATSRSERRQITALICRQHAPNGHSDPEELHQRLVRCGSGCRAILDRYGGQREQHHGDGCLIYFGYPQTYEDAARRAVHAGLAMVTAGQGGDSVHVGIHTGVMVVGGSHGSGSTSHELIGDVPSVARACQSLAGPDTVLMTESTERLVRGWFDCQNLGSQTLAGTAQPLEVYCAWRESDMQSRLRWLAQMHHLTPLVGRENELNQLIAHLGAAVQGSGQVVTLSGEPGIGKSRLVYELRQVCAPSVAWLESHCLPYFQNTSLHPMIDLLEQLLGFADDDSPEARRAKLNNTLARYGLGQPAAVWLLSLMLGLPTDTPAPESITAEQRARMREVFVALAQKRAADQPLLLVIEDLHWADPSTVEWLGQSLDALVAVPCLILLTSRPTFTPAWPPQAHVFSLALGPLNPIETEQMLSELAGNQPLRDEVRQRIIAQTDGIPLFIEELTRTVLESNHQTLEVSETSRVLPEIPATLRDSLMARLDRVGAAKETAHWAAALGREFSYPVLQAVVPFDEERLQHDLAQLIEADLVHRPGQTTTNYSFKHTLVQEAAYASLLKRTRQDYHRRIAETLETRFPQTAETQPEILAQHYASAGLHLQAVDYWLRAGEQAIAHGATLEAKAFFDRALELTEPTDSKRRWRALLGREEVFNLREEREAQIDDIHSLLELAETFDDDTCRAQAFLRQAQYDLRKKDFKLMLHATETAAASAARAGNHALEMRALSFKVTALAYIEDWIAAHQAVEETLARLPGVADEVIRAYALGDVAFYYSRVGDLSRALPLMRQGAGAARRAGNRQKESRLDLNIGFVLVQLGRFAEARAALEAGLALAEAIGDRALQTSHLYNLSYVYWCSGDRDKARVLGERALLEFRTTGHNPLGHACCLTYLGVYLEEAGDWTAAATYLAEARAELVRIRANMFRMEAQAVEARCRLALGRREEAQQLAAEVWVHLHERGTEGMDFPSRAYVCVADVCNAMETSGISAREVIEASYRDLMQRAEKISDAEWRRSFLENVAENRAVVERWQAVHETHTRDASG